MASTTEAPQQDLERPSNRESEPLLGRAGDASQREGRPLGWNLIIGTAVIAQAGVIILFGIVWGTIFSKQLSLFVAHPLLNSAGVVFITQALLILQPTHTPTQKRNGTYVHASLNGVGLLALIVGLIIIVYSKFASAHTHFESPHAILGLITYIFLVIQASVGFTQYWVPQLYGGVENAKKMYKYHRMTGYVVLILLLATVCAATYTDYNVNVLGMKLWAVIVASVLILVGMIPRVKKQKLGL